MLLHLLENAENSLLVGLDFYSKYLNCNCDISLTEHYGNLKFAIIGIHNSVELLIKKLLSQVDELLIYDDETIDNPEVLSYIGKTYNEKEKIHLSYFMAHFSEKFKTISYSKCLIRFKACFNISENEIKILEKLNQYRNVLTHFGLEDINDQDKIIFILNYTLNIINNRIIPLVNKEKIQVEDEYNKVIEEFLHEYQNSFFEIWEACNEFVIQYYNDKICEIINQNVFEDMIGEKVEFSYDGNKLVLKGKEKEIILCIDDIPEKNISIIVHNNLVLAIMDYDVYKEGDVSIICPNMDLLVEDFRILQSCKWRDTINSIYKVVPLNSGSFKEKVLKKCI